MHTHQNGVPIRKFQDAYSPKWSTYPEVSGYILTKMDYLSGSFRMHTHQNGVPIRKCIKSYVISSAVKPIVHGDERAVDYL